VLFLKADMVLHQHFHEVFHAIKAGGCASVV
jgi:hypothetical protein